MKNEDTFGIIVLTLFFISGLLIGYFVMTPRVYKQNSASTETINAADRNLQEDLLAMGYTPRSLTYPNGQKEITWSK